MLSINNVKMEIVTMQSNSQCNNIIKFTIMCNNKRPTVTRTLYCSSLVAGPAQHPGIHKEQWAAVSSPSA